MDDTIEIDLTQGKGYKDFEKGFYATAIKSHAENIAKKTNIYLKQWRQRKFRYKVKVYKVII